MSFYRLLTAPLACGYCGEERPASIQFRTGGEDNLESYDAGTPAPSNHGMAMDTPFTAHADWYCTTCSRKRKSGEVEGLYLGLVNLVEANRLTIEQPGFLFKKPVTPDMLKARASEEAALMLTKPPKKYGHLFSRLGDYQLVLDDMVLQHGTGSYNDFIDLLNLQIAKHLKSTGWPHAGLIRNDLEVRLTPSHQWVVQQAP